MNIVIDDMLQSMRGRFWESAATGQRTWYDHDDFATVHDPTIMPPGTAMRMDVKALVMHPMWL